MNHDVMTLLWHSIIILVIITLFGHSLRRYTVTGCGAVWCGVVWCDVVWSLHGGDGDGDGDGDNTVASRSFITVIKGH